LPNALEVRIDPEFAVQSRPDRTGPARGARTPAELFAEFCAVENVADPRVAALFGELHDEVTAAGGAD
jgi:exonuclease SbcD